jgi:hypothetical protein
MLGDQPGRVRYLKAILMGEIGLSEKSTALLIEEYGEFDVQRQSFPETSRITPDSTGYLIAGQYSSAMLFAKVWLCVSPPCAFVNKK